MSQHQKPESNALLGIILMLLSTVIFSLMNVGIRWVSQQLHAFEIAFFRNLFGLLFMLPWLFVYGFSQLKTQRLRLFWIRAILGLVSMLGFFWAMTVMPLPQAVSLSFTVPIFVTLGAALFLGETVHWRRWLAIIVGFIGTLIILRPGYDANWLASLVVIGTSVTIAASILIIKDLSKTEASNVIVTYMVLMLVPLSLPPAIAVWEWPTASNWLILVLIGGCGSAAHILFTNALKVADVSTVMPFDFGRLLFVIFFSWLVFSYELDYWVLLGASIVFASGLYIAQRESKLHKKKVVLNKRISGPS